jgi:hypothetical protein
MPFVYWKEGPDNRPWNIIPDTPESRAVSLAHGAMFFTWNSFSEPYQGNGHPESNRIGDAPYDFDCKDDPGKALSDTRQLCLIHLPELYDVDPYTIRFFMSGSKGLHAEIPAKLFGAEKGDPYLPLIYKRIAADWTARFNLSTMDLSLYCMKKGKMFRVENVRRGNGRYKVPVTLEEVRDLSINELTALTRSQRQIEKVDVDLDPVDDLVKLYQDAKTTVYQELKDQDETGLSGEQLERLAGNTPPCIEHILHDNPAKSDQVNFNRLLLLIISYFHTAGIQKTQAWAKSEHFVRSYSHSETYSTPEKRTEAWRAMWCYLANNESYRFSCSYALGLRLPGNAFDCQKCLGTKRKSFTRKELSDKIEALDGEKDFDLLTGGIVKDVLGSGLPEPHVHSLLKFIAKKNRRLDHITQSRGKRL